MLRNKDYGRTEETHKQPRGMQPRKLRSIGVVEADGEKALAMALSRQHVFC